MGEKKRKKCVMKLKSMGYYSFFFFVSSDAEKNRYDFDAFAVNLISIFLVIIAKNH